jgi:hypothetical protein
MIGEQVAQGCAAYRNSRRVAGGIGHFHLKIELGVSRDGGIGR